MSRVINSKSIAQFCSLVEETNWAEVYAESNPSAAYNVFLEKIIFSYEKAFPRIPVKKHSKAKKEWITPALFKRINKKNSLFARFLQTRHQYYLLESKKFRNKLSADLK